ncbi:GTP cyclohydrolase I FolE [Stomatohabitans albus]|uniref:GTP cyclohydrolase I FolE n=1 Tax=Stomatohabitans albus TaxID=3110766 RepID=UPI00300D4578
MGSPADSVNRIRVATNAEPRGQFNHEQIRNGVEMIFQGLGLDVHDPRIVGTPDRVARMYDEIFAGLLVDPADVLDTTFNEGHEDIVLVRDIPFASVCEHHLIPFFGKAHVGYLPNKDGHIAGLSKIARVVDVVAKRPQLQERITTEVADVLEKKLSPRGVIVQIEAEHLCMNMRGVRKPGAITVTSSVRGLMRSDPRTRAEVMSLIHGGRL